MKTALMGLTLALMLPVSAQAAWHAIMVSGDDSIRNFDNSRDALGELFAAKGLAAENQHHLNSQFSLEAKPPADQATLQALALSFTQLNIRPEQDACLFYVSSHGKQGDGVYMKRVHDGQLTPAQLNTALNWTCGTAPTVVMVSACYSGQFIQPLHADNRIIMTAASAQRPSFGCSEAQEYSFGMAASSTILSAAALGKTCTPMSNNALRKKNSNWATQLHSHKPILAKTCVA